MDLETRCGFCGSYKWCGRQCRFAPKSTLPPKPVTAKEAAAHHEKLTSGEGLNPTLAPLIAKVTELAGKYDRNAAHREYMREYMRRKRAASKPGP